MRVEIFSNDIVMNIGIVIFFILFSFILFIFVTFIVSLLKKEKKPKTDLGQLAFVSAIIPAYNEQDTLPSCLNSVIKSDYPLNKLQIIIVDDQSTDNTLKLAEDFRDKHKNLDISVISGKHQGKVGALNQGLKNSKHNLILSLDSDVILEKNTIKELVKPMYDKNVAATNCIALIKKPQNIIEHFQRIEFFLFNLIRVSFSKVFDNSIWFFGVVACYKKDVLEKIGSFKKDTLTEDMDICLELYNKGYKIITVPQAIIVTKACSTLKKLFKQRMRWYYGALQALVKNKRLLTQKRHSPAVYFLFFNQFWWTFFAFIFFPLIIYQIIYWFPPASAGPLTAFMYLFRWFSLLGPVYVLYKLPEWGLSFLNIFGVMSGIITTFNIIGAMKQFRGRVTPATLVAIFFFFPYTIILNMIIISCVVKYSFAKKRYFID